MAQKAVEHVTPIEWWSLEDLLEYLTLAPFRYEMDAALRKIERAISTGDLPLIVDRLFDGKLQSFEIDPFAFRAKYTLVLNDYDMVVRIVPRPRFPGAPVQTWGGDSGRVIKQDALRVWSRCPPASQAPRQLEGKANPAEAADRPSAVQSPQERKEGPQVRRLRQALKEKYPPDGHPPIDMTLTAILKSVDGIFEREGWKFASPDTLARVMGRRA